jgi:REP element-mobilizing transposase RayT
MIYSEIGAIAEKYWNEIPLHFPFVRLGPFIVMPNHVHGILIINKSDDPSVGGVETPKLGVSTQTGGDKNDKWKPGNLGVIVNQYKRICTIQSRKINPDFAWQSRFYEHIIRDDESYHKIAQYIENNPVSWDEDD